MLKLFIGFQKRKMGRWIIDYGELQNPFKSAGDDGGDLAHHDNDHLRLSIH